MMLVIIISILAVYLYSVVALWAFGVSFRVAVLYPRLLLSEWFGGYNKYLEKTVIPKLTSDRGKNFDKWM